MKHKVDRLTNRLTAIISSWPGVECILSCECGETDTIDPYFALILDVYCSGHIPDDASRQSAFGDPGAFESSRGREKDRFFIDGLPVRVEYKRTSGIEDLLDNKFDSMWVFRGAGTYMLYRIVNGKVLYQRSDWINRVRNGLADTPADFWERLVETHMLKMEHCLSDLGGAAFKDDRYFFIVSLSGFVRSCASALFARNQQWEPSDRNLTEALLELSCLPEDFSGRWESLLRTDGSLNPERKYQIAQLIARSMFAQDCQ
ncbi:MAG: DUF4037 domain-containing protein [Clostridia bacterium]|jgi:hypothetical protein|nr:DUF4037 domain-containing protein [Spirochaetia bacterium]